VWRVGLRGNRVLLAIVTLTLAAVVTIFVVPAARNAFDLGPLSPGGWAVAVAAAAFTTGVWELLKLRRRR
jgi:hypothetical protein